VFAHIAHFNFDYCFVIYTKFKHKTHYLIFFFNQDAEPWEILHIFNHVLFNFYSNGYDTSFFLYWHLKAYGLFRSVTMLYKNGEFSVHSAAF